MSTMQNNQIMLWNIGLQSSSTQNFAGLKTIGHTTSQLVLTLAEMLGDSYSKKLLCQAFLSTVTCLPVPASSDEWTSTIAAL